MPISRILREGGRFDDAAGVLREWCGVSDASAATDAFCELLEASPGLMSLEFTMDTKGHWRRNWVDRAMFDRIMDYCCFEFFEIMTRIHYLSTRHCLRYWSHEPRDAFSQSQTCQDA